MSNERHIDQLLAHPRETLEVEHKEWLDLGLRADQAKLARELIALANHGGGFLIFGLADDEELQQVDGQPVGPTRQVTIDQVNGIVARFAEPSFHVDVVHRRSPDTSQVHPVLIVPAGEVPIRAKRSGPDGVGIVEGKYYIRRPGPNSEPPRSGREWSRLINRCVLSARKELLDGLHLLLSSDGSSSAGTVAETELTEFVTQCDTRWRELVSTLSDGAPGRLGAGHWSFAFEFERRSEAGVRELRDAVSRAERRLTGWPPFWAPSRPELRPRADGGAVECWFGRAPLDGQPDNADYWRVDVMGRGFLRRGYHADGPRWQGEPGLAFPCSIPVWRVAECLLFAGRLAEELEVADGPLQVHFEWTGLAGRELHFEPSPWGGDGRYRAHADHVTVTRSVPLDRLALDLAQRTYELVDPLFAAFDFYRPSLSYVQDQVRRLVDRA